MEEQEKKQETSQLKHLARDKSEAIANEIIEEVKAKHTELSDRMISLVLCKAGIILRKKK